MSRKHVESHYGAYIVGSRRDPETGERGTLVQTDWDYPATASDLGWNIRRVQKVYDGKTIIRKTAVLSRAPRRGYGCDHSGTDGTVACPDCGITAGDFIAAAAKYLDSLC